MNGTIYKVLENYKKDGKKGGRFETIEGILDIVPGVDNENVTMELRWRNMYGVLRFNVETLQCLEAELIKHEPEEKIHMTGNLVLKDGYLMVEDVFVDFVKNYSPEFVFARVKKEYLDAKSGVHSANARLLKAQKMMEKGPTEDKGILEV